MASFTLQSEKPKPTTVSFQIVLKSKIPLDEILNYDVEAKVKSERWHFTDDISIRNFIQNEILSENQTIEELVWDLELIQNADIVGVSVDLEN